MQTFTNAANNVQQQQQHPHPTTHLSLHQDQQILPEHQHHLHHMLSTMPAATSSSITPSITSLNKELYTSLVTSESSSQYCSSTEVSLLNCSRTSSSSSSSSNDCNSPCLSPASSNSSNLSERKSTPSIGVNLRVTGQCSQGGRKYMEDYFSVAYQQSENAKDLEYAFIGIYDGHGGAEAATFAKEHLMMEIINQRLFWSDSDHDVLRAIREGYIATHYAMWREQDKWPKTANGLPSTAGTTATVAFIRREKIYIGHVGDSGIVLGYQNENEHFWRAKQLTVDHKPESVEERTRIMKSGGKVVVKSGVPRVVWNRPRNASHRGPIKHKTLVDEIPFLAVARSLGDLWSYNSERNEFVVSPDPDVKVIPINSKTFRCLIFGTDGLWNVVNAQEAVNTVREKEIINERLQAQRGDSPHDNNQWTNPSKSLVDQALKTWSSKKMRADNTSVVTVILYPPGQGGHNNDNQIDKDVSISNAPPAFMQPASYGLEYTQVQAEIPTHDDTTTYKEMAMKYLPPEEYRNFNYYADDSDRGEETETDESDGEDSVITPKPPIENFNRDNYQMQTNTWNWQHNNTINHHITEDETGYAEDTEEDEEEIEDDEEDEEVTEEEDEVDETSTTNVANEREVCVMDYHSYLQIGTEEANTATDSYINTFAESYNTLLTAAQSECIRTVKETEPSTTVGTVITPTNSNSNSSSNLSNCQSVSPPNMHALIEEQQLYQQQCMSEEDGYSLTKLETRREQQSCKSQGPIGNGVETFKIFHHADIQHENPQSMEVYNSGTERYYQPHTSFIPSQLQQEPLELHSLLQQEREEEEQVAYERRQMQNKLGVSHEQQNITAYTCLQSTQHESSLPSTSAYALNHTLTHLNEEKEAHLMDVDDIIEEVGDTIIEEESSVQIHEISSSSSCGEESRLHEDDEVEEMRESLMEPTTSFNIEGTVVEEIEKIDILQEVTYEMCKPSVDRTIESDVLRNKSLLNQRKCLTIKKTNSCLPPPPPSIVLTPSPVKGGKRSRSFVYAKVQNENLERISGKSNHSLYPPHNQRRNLNMTPTSSSKSPAALIIPSPVASSTPMIQRQLRSNTSNCSSNTSIDYGKRTLRTRNSLTKDMKSKSAFVQAALKYPHNAATRKFLQRTGAAALLVAGNPVLLQDQHLTPTNRRSLNTTANGHSVSRNIKTRNSSTNTPLPSTSLHLNLRSRQSSTATSSSNIININSSVDSLSCSPPPPPPSTSTPVIKRASLVDRRNLRNTRSSSRIGPPVQASFSKSTRSQGTGTNLAAPPPSPKMINAAAAVAAAATRARSLLSQKHAAQANGTTSSVVSAVFGKRVNLRSNGVTTNEVAMVSGNANSSAMNSGQNSVTVGTSTTHQTLRGRIVKKFKR